MRSLLAVLAISMLPISGYCLDIQKIHGDFSSFVFNNDQGEGVARDLQVELGSDPLVNQQASVPQTIYLQRVGNDLHLSFGVANIVWKGIPEWLTSQLELSANDILMHLGYSPTQAIKAKSIRFSRPDLGNATVKELQVVCTPLQSESTKFENIIKQCLNHGNIQAAELDVPLLKKFWSEVLTEQTDENDGTQVGGDIVLNLEKNNFDLALKTKIFIHAKVKASGKIDLDEKTNLASIRVDSIMFGKLNIAHLVFPALKRILPKGFEVKPPYIYVQL